MIATRLFKSESHLLGLTELIWFNLGEVDNFEGFAAHPKIGAIKPLEKVKNNGTIQKNIQLENGNQV